MLTPFSRFDIKRKKLKVKIFWKCIFRVSKRMSFTYFSRFALVNVCLGGGQGKGMGGLTVYTF